MIIILRFLGFWQGIELNFYDLYATKPLGATEQEIDDRFVIVEVAEEDFRDFKEFANYPVPDYILADLLEKILVQKPAVVGLDLYRDISHGDDPIHEQRLHNLFKNTKNLIGIETAIPPKVLPPPALKGTYRNGANDILLDPDGVLRRAMMAFDTKEDGKDVHKNTFALLLAFNYLENFKKIEVPQARYGYLKFGDTVVDDIPENAGSYVKVDSGGYQFLINWRIPPNKWNYVRVSDVLKDKIDSDIFKDKIVLIGPTARSLNDFIPVPYERPLSEFPPEIPGVAVQANITKQLIDLGERKTSLIQFLPENLEVLFISMWFVLTFLVLSFKSFRGKENRLLFDSALLIVALFLSAIIFTYLAFLRQNYWLPIFPVLLVIGCGGFFTALGIYVDLTRQKNKQLEFLNEQIENRNQELKEINEKLDSRVKERTQSLEDTNLELKETYRQLQEKTKQLIAQEKLSRLGLMVREIQHDLAVPVGAVYNNSILLLEQIESYKKQSELIENNNDFSNFLDKIEKDYLKPISSQAQTCKDFLDSFDSQNLLNPGQDNQRILLKKGNFNQIVSAYIKKSQKLFYEKRKKTLHSLRTELKDNYCNLQVKKELDDEIEEFYLDSNALSRVVTNLLLNGFDTVISKQKKEDSSNYCPMVKVQTINKKKKVVLIIEDNGEGIPESELTNIFDPSYSTKRKTGGGSGIGLYSVYNLVRSFSGGTIQVNSTLGEGTTFRIEWMKFDSEQQEFRLSDRREILFFANNKS